MQLEAGATSGKLRRKSSVFSRRLKAGRELAEMTTWERVFQTRAAATGNARSPTVDSRDVGMIRKCDDDDRRSLLCWAALRARRVFLALSILVIFSAIRVVCYNILYYMNRHRLLCAILLSVFLVEVGFTCYFVSFYYMLNNTHGEAGRTLTREVLLSLRRAALKPDHSTRQHIASLGCAHRRGCRGGRAKTKHKHFTAIPVVIGRRHNNIPVTTTAKTRQRTIVRVKTQPTPTRSTAASPTCSYISNGISRNNCPPSLY